MHLRLVGQLIGQATSRNQESTEQYGHIYECQISLHLEEELLSTETHFHMITSFKTSAITNPLWKWNDRQFLYLGMRPRTSVFSHSVGCFLADGTLAVV